jgi:hypothetical protein
MTALGLTQQQHDTRRRGLGGSDIAAVLGLDPYRGPWDDEAVVECVRLATLEQLGRDLARRIDEYCVTAEAAKKRAYDADDLVEVGDATEAANLAAADAGNCLSCVIALVGSGDTITTQHAIAASRTARTHAAMAERRWLQLVKLRVAHA